jgi:predicted metal-binding membrane protein
MAVEKFPTSEMEPPLALRDPATILTSVVVLVIAAAAWVSVIASSLTVAPEMSMDDMSMNVSTLSLAAVLAFVLSWGVMMAAMMLPSALPMIALYGAIRRKSVDASTRGVSVTLFTAVYLALWTITGFPVYVAGVLLAATASHLVPYGIAIVLVAAGVYQLSPWKQVCLRACRSPLGFLLGHWRAGRRGSLALGWTHATYCLGCCWALMVVLVAAGAMGFAWVLLIAAVVTAEKLAPKGEWIARVAGGALVLLGVAGLVRPDLVSLLRGAHPM